MLLVCRFGPEVTAPDEARPDEARPDEARPDEARPDETAFLARARRAVALLAAQPGCERVELARAVEVPGEWVLVAVFASLTDYRRALGPFEVREHVVPLLSDARTDLAATFERRLSAPAGDGDGVREHPSILE